MTARARKRSSNKLGLAPGSTKYIGKRKAEKTVSELIQFDKENNVNYAIESPTDALEKIESFQGKSWLHITGLSNISSIKNLCKQFRIHPLVIEDIFNTEQRAKIDIYDNYIYIVLQMRCDTQQLNSPTEFQQISFIVTKNYLITIQEHDFPIFNGVKKRIDNANSKIRSCSTDYLTYSLLDSIVDDYFQIVEKKENKIEKLEQTLLDEPDKTLLAQIYLMKREYLHLRKRIMPVKEIVVNIMNEENIFQPSVNLYFRDLYDHSLRIIETIDTYREMLVGMLDVYLSTVNQRLNETMRILTIFSTLFIPLTFICSVYGMNFEFMPELSWRYGYFVCWGIMASVAGGLLMYFKRRGWL